MAEKEASISPPKLPSNSASLEARRETIHAQHEVNNQFNQYIVYITLTIIITKIIRWIRDNIELQ